jgi:hypothetical protein
MVKMANFMLGVFYHNNNNNNNIFGDGPNLTYGLWLASPCDSSSPSP